METSQDTTPSVAAEEGHESRNIGNTEDATDATHQPKSREEKKILTASEGPMDTTRVEEPKDQTPQENKPLDSAEKYMNYLNLTSQKMQHTKSEAATAHASHGEKKATVGKVSDL